MNKHNGSTYDRRHYRFVRTPERFNISRHREETDWPAWAIILVLLAFSFTVAWMTKIGRAHV